MSLSMDTRLSDRRHDLTLLSPEVALDMVLRSRPSTPAIEEARRISLARRAAQDTHAAPETRVDPSSAQSRVRPLGRGTNLQQQRSSYARPLRANAAPRESDQRNAIPLVRRQGAGEPSDATASGAAGTRPDRRTVALSDASTRNRPGQRPAVGAKGQVRPVDSPLHPTARPTRAVPGTARRTAPAPALAPSPAPAPARGVRSTETFGAAALARTPEIRVAPSTAPAPRARLSAVPVPTSGRNRSGAAITGTVAGAVLLVVAFSSVGLHGNLAKNQLVLDQLRSDISVEEQSNQRLRVEVAELQAPQRIVSEAERMGMAPSTEVVFLNARSVSSQPAATVPPADAIRSGN